MGSCIDAGIVFRAYLPAQIHPLIDTLGEVWADAHPELMQNPEEATADLSVAALHRQVAGHLKHQGFVLVAAYSAGTMVGFGYAFPCTPEYWFGRDLLPKIPEPVRQGRLMGLCELAVRPPWQSQGVGSRIHAELLKAIAPQWSSLLVLPPNERGHALYHRLGYRYAGPYRNAQDGPVYDLLLMQVRE
ncbi:GNAT family N-acetyltransferase [Streptomyces sp. B1866]|uniref:GNAT family N-acetyltransferase n=1 Tax=Streptomyces sp. B1866 TaxID=3075431 RepID=UPI00289015A1|nr:GNAT family N-acetyltransferase [Streptomyces sp. B1866]MDT3396824.1 GNAT family N-acetyltransferase [Streptomyces sp. B1866]